MKKMGDKEDLTRLLVRGVDKIYPSKEAIVKVLQSGKKLKLYQGFDPTGDKLHIGHMVGLRKLAQWQKLGHEVIFLIGDGTGQAGDPSGKTKKREKFFTREELRQNALDYVKQAGKIVNFESANPVKILYNGDWLNKLTLVDILKIFEHFTHSKLFERDLFRERAKRGEEISMREFIYPVLQAYDSVAMEVDLEIGATDQTFNMLCGRDLVKAMQNREKFVLTTPLLVDAEGRKIGKTEGNVIALTDAPTDLFGKIMSLSDEVIVPALEYLSELPDSEIKNIDQAIKSGENPMTYKKLLAEEVVSQLYDRAEAEQAKESFSKAFQKKEIPENPDEITGQGVLADILISGKVVKSKSEALRLFKAGAVTDLTSDKKVSEKDIAEIGHVYKIGKHRFVKIK